MRQLENISFRPALRLGRRQIPVYLQGDKHPTLAWSNYNLARDIEHPVQKMPKVGHCSLRKSLR